MKDNKDVILLLRKEDFEYKMFFISRRLYENIVQTIGKYKNESGGFIGSENHVEITNYVFDRSGDSNSYMPDAEHLNTVIHNWKSRGIIFQGFIHSHKNRAQLSYADILFAREFLKMNKLEHIFMGIYVIDGMSLNLYMIEENQVKKIDYEVK